MGTILIVDDDLPLCKLLGKIFEESGYPCCSAADAAQARTLLAGQPFDLLLSDIHMPGESGLDLIQFAKAAYPEMAVMIMSGFDDSQDARSALMLDAYGYLVKPFERTQVLITIGNALIRRDLEIEAKNHRETLENTVRQRTARLTQLVGDLKIAEAEAAAAVRHQEDQLLFLRTLVNATPNPIYYKDASGVYQGCNHAFEAYLGLGRKDIIGKTIYEVAPKETADINFQADIQLLQGAGQQTYETIIPHADDTVRDVLINKATFLNSACEIAGIVGVMVDITEQKKNERALRISEEKIRNILNNISIGVAVTSPEMILLESNEKMQQWFPSINLEQHPVCYKAIMNPQGEHPCEMCPTLKTLADGKVYEAIIQKKEANGTRSFRVISSAIHDSDGHVAAVIELVDEITEKLFMERELLQTQKLASIGQLAAGVAHEINNPTGFVSSNLKTLNDYQVDLNTLIDQYQTLIKAVKKIPPSEGLDNVAQLIETIEATEAEVDLAYIRSDLAELIQESRDGIERIKRIVEDLKHFAHPGQDKVQDTDINAELNSTLNIVNNELKYKTTVIKELGELPILTANPQQLNQVFANILVNAAQAIETRGEIRIKTLQVGGFVEIQISDTGCGIAEENLEKIFDPFFTTKPVGKGTGLGMNIAFGIIQKHHGEILVDSCVGQGTCFTIRLPLDHPAEQLTTETIQ